MQDGGSTDGTLDILSGYSAETISAPDEGIYDAINKGISRATGDIVGLLHSDDFFASETVLCEVARAFEDPSVDGVYGDLQYVSAQNRSRVIRHWISGSYSPERLKYGWMPPHPTLYLRREVYERWGHYDTSFRIAADYDAMLRWMTAGQVNLFYLPQVLVKMRAGGASNRSLAQILLKSREDLRAIRGNGVGGVPTLACKNLRKVGQLIYREATTS